MWSPIMPVNIKDDDLNKKNCEYIIRIESAYKIVLIVYTQGFS